MRHLSSQDTRHNRADGLKCLTVVYRNMSNQVTRLKARARVLGSWLVTSCWILGIIVGVQGWTPVGANWFTSSGSSLWSSCGSAMCACPLEIKTEWQNQQRLAKDQPIASQRNRASSVDADCPLCLGAAPTSSPAPTTRQTTSRRTNTLFCFVALGTFRPQQSQNEGSLSEPLIVDMPPAQVAFSLLELQTGHIAALSECLVAQASFTPEPPPPRRA